MIGQTVGHYRILDRLGVGGMGEVYRAEDTKLKRQVAIKVLPPEVAGSQERLHRFRREAEVVASLNHPNIVMIHSVEEIEGLHFLTMELVEGTPLQRAIPRGGLSVERYFEIAVPLADALSAAHEKGIVHRDLKPDNIMISDRGVVKVLDFGLAKLVSVEAEADATSLPTETLTREGRVQGTIPYMSPEQARAQEVDHQTDIFSLGVVLHEMASGRRLFEGDSSADTISAILTQEPEPVSDLRPDLPFHLTRIIAHCLVKNRSHRYQSTQDLRDELAGLKREVESGRIRTESISRSGFDFVAKQSSRAKWIAASLILAAVISSLVLVMLWSRPDAGARAALAVMPFENLTGEPEKSYVGEGLSAGLITQLMEIGGLSVVGRSEAWSLRGKNLSSRQIGKQLGVEMVVEGGLLPGKDIRLEVTLTDARTGLVLWSESFSGNRSDIFEVEKEITRELTRVLAIPLSRVERSRLAKNPTASLRAYDYYLQGQQYLEDVDNPDGAGFARDLFRQAIRVDPDFALAHAGLSDSLWRIFQRRTDASALQEAEREAERALELDPQLPAAQVALARVYRSTGRYAQSIGQLRQILSEHPNPAEAYRQLAYSYEEAGDLDAAEESLRYALALRSDDWHLWNSLGAFLVMTGNYTEAKETFGKAAELAPQSVTWPQENLATVRILEGDFEGAIRAFEQIEQPTEDPSLLANIGTAYFFTDHLDEAEKYYKQAVRLRPSSPIEHGNLADLYLRQGRVEEARASYFEALKLVEVALEANPKDANLRVDRALFAAKAGQCEKAMALADRLQTELPEVGEYHHDRAVAYAICGNRESALRALSRAIDLGVSPDFIGKEDEFQSFKDDPGFIELMGQNSKVSSNAPGLAPQSWMWT